MTGLLAAVDHLISAAARHLPAIEALRLHGLLTAEVLLLTLVGLLLLLILPPLADRLIRQWGWMEPNYRRDLIPQSYGLVILLWTSLLFAACFVLFPSLHSLYMLWLTTCCGFGLLGLADDRWGTKTIKGLRGHLRAALHDRIITTGFVKAVGGTLLALGLGWPVGHGSFPLAILAAGLIALAANAVNLLDLRPGRAGGVWLIAALLLVLGLRAPASGAPPLLLVAIPTLVVWRRDARAQVMMGDTGSNLLGACLGLAVAQTCTRLEQVLALILLVGLNLLAERVSLTHLIENNPVLRALDRMTGVR